VTISEQPLLAEMALAARNIEWHKHVVADRKVVYLSPDFLDHAYEFVTECHPHAGVRHHAVVKMKV
jgi:hypothetical protein